jgi:transcription factor TFIIIB component B''
MIAKPKFKVQVGLVTQKIPVFEQNLKSNSSNHENINFQSTNIALASLCNSSFEKKNPKKRKGTISPVKTVVLNERVAVTVEREAGPRVEIIDGKIVLKEASTIIDKTAKVNDDELEEIVEEGNNSSRYSSYLPKRKCQGWNVEETKKFYSALQQCGTEFSIMESFFPSKSRKQLKQKFFREEKYHPELVKRALESTLPLELPAIEESEEKG